MWNLSGPWLENVSPALAVGFSTPAPPRKTPAKPLKTERKIKIFTNTNLSFLLCPQSTVKQHLKTHFRRRKTISDGLGCKSLAEQIKWQILLYENYIN